MFSAARPGAPGTDVGRSDSPTPSISSRLDAGSVLTSRTRFPASARAMAVVQASDIDDIYGIDAINNDSDPLEDSFHGTHVAGIIGAAGNNGTGTVGVSWNSRIMACKFMGPSGGYTSDAIECLQYVKTMKDRGVNIVATNNSWGYTGESSQALKVAIAAQQDILFIAAAGNSAADNDSVSTFPANYDLPNVISVAATDNYDNLASFSNFGESLSELAGRPHR